MWIFNIKFENTIAAYELGKRFKKDEKERRLFHDPLKIYKWKIYIYKKLSTCPGSGCPSEFTPIGDLSKILALLQSERNQPFLHRTLSSASSSQA